VLFSTRDFQGEISTLPLVDFECHPRGAIVALWSYSRGISTSEFTAFWSSLGAERDYAFPGRVSYRATSFMGI